MTPASVLSRFPAARRAWLSATAAAALSLPAADLCAQAVGSVDPSFNAGVLGSTIYALDYVTDTDGTVKLTVGGDRGYGQYLLNSLQSIPPVPQPNGLPSASFFLPLFGNAARIIFTIVPERAPAGDNLLPNLLFGGSFDGGFGRGTNGNKPPQNIVRITPQGDLDTGFASGVGTGANNYVTSILPLDDGRIVVGGLFTMFNRQPHRRVVRLANNGTPDPSFATGANIDNDVLALAESIDPVTLAPDGSTLVGGTFNHVAGLTYGKLVRLDANGNLDMSFHPSIDLRVITILVQADGKIVIGGDFTNVNGAKVSRLARLNYDGSLDPSFVGGVTGVPNKDVNPTAVYVLRQIADGRIYVGGEFAQVNGAPRQYLGLINPDGSLDNTFDPGRGIIDSVESITVQSDDNVLVGQTLATRVNGKLQPSLVRLIGAPLNAGAAAALKAVKTTPAASTRP